MGLPYYRFFPGDYARDTRRLTLLQHGAYRLLIDEYMTAGGLRGDLPALCRICLASSNDEREAVAYVVAEFFKPNGAGWHHDRCDRELGAIAAKCDAARDSALRRWSEGNANAMRTHSEGNASQSQSQSQSQNQISEPKPEPKQTKVKTVATGSRKKPRSPAPSGPLWEAYSVAYLTRYATEPVRNAKVNSELAGVLKRLGEQEAPAVATHYVQHQRSIYVAAKHPTSLFLRDCEGLRTEWATGRNVTDTQARQGDKTASSGFMQLLQEKNRG